MKKCVCLLLLVAFLGCRKNNDTGNYPLLVEIRAEYGLNHTYEYENGLLVKDNYYMQFCPANNPVDEREYIYSGGRLVGMEITMRSLYSSTTALCSGTGGVLSTEQIEYDAQGRIIKSTRERAYSTYHYNSDSRVIKHVVYDLPTATAVDSTMFTYDFRGNITTETDSRSNTVTTYQYDNKKNPHYLIKQNPTWVSVYNSSPNNVIKGTGPSYSFERKILSYRNDMPSRIRENGVVYEYIYQ